jgi:exopolysaccharide production protein ExoQ
MLPTAALCACFVLVLVLLRIEARRNDAASAGLWIPTLWMLIAGSRSVGRWMGTDEAGGVDYEAGSLPDRLVLAGLTALAIAILLRRKVDWPRLLKDNVWLLVLFLYMGLSILWMDSPFVSLKRWIRSTGPVVMAFVIASELKPQAALESVLRRCAYVLVPLSFVLIKYYPALGRAYGRWDGVEMWTGTTTHKNSLGQLCAVSAFLLIWSLLRTERSRDRPVTWVETAADLSILLLTAYLLRGPGTYSATSISITVIGLAVFFVLRRRRAIGWVVVRNLKVLMVLVAVLYWFVAEPATDAVTSLLGRSRNLTGRATDIWPVVLELASRHPIFGLGYGGAWGLGGSLSATVGVEQAHNGYLDVYLQLGSVGIILLAAFLLSFCTAIRRVFNVEYDWSTFGAAFLLMVLLYNLSETAFFDVYLGSAMVLLPVVFTAAGSVVVATEPRKSRIPSPVVSTWRPPLPRGKRPVSVQGRNGRGGTRCASPKEINIS